MGCYDAVCCLSAFCVGWYNIVSCGAGGVLLVFLLWVGWVRIVVIVGFPGVLGFG